MNPSIEMLNHWGENLLSFAWPMLWQSSLLIVVVFALDYLLARRVRAAIRHALWMVVLVKLLLPPALALPTGATWWLWPAKPPLTPVFKSETVTFDSSALPENFAPQTVPFVLPLPKLNGTGWMMLASGAVSAGLLLSLLFQWAKVERKTRHAAASGDFASALEQARQLAGLRGPMRLRLVDDTISPAVYGLFRPVILLPRALAEKLSIAQLRAVLLHEAIHLRRGDVWVNCAQTLLQIAYWWHPLLWLANARIRRLREEAVDDTVMVALRGDADAYAPTLLEVAKFAFRRPLASLGLVGILESRSALRQRVERLVDFRPPRRAGVTFLSLCAIFLFGAVTLPMGQAPAITTESASAISQFSPASAPSQPIQILIEGRFFWMPSGDMGALTAGLPHLQGHAGGGSDWMAATNAKTLAEINQRIHALNLKLSSAPRIVGNSGNEASIYVGNQTNWFKWICTPFATDGQIDLTFKTEAGSVSSPGKTNLIEFHGQATMENKGGIVICAKDPNDSSSNLVFVISVKMIETASASANTNKLEMRTFKMNTNSFLVGLQERMPSYYEYPPDPKTIKSGEGFHWVEPVGGSNDIGNLVHQYFTNLGSKLGINLEPPKSMFYNNDLGVLFVSATPQDLNIIESNIVQICNTNLVPFTLHHSTYNLDSERRANNGLLVGKKYYEPGPPDHGPVNTNDLIQRTFSVSYSAFYAAVYRETGESNGFIGFKDIAAKSGVDFSPPKAIFLNGTGLLYVYATKKDMDTIQGILDYMNCRPPQVHIKARFIEMPSDSSQIKGLAMAGTNNATGMVGILTASEMKTVLHLLMSQKGVETLAEPEGVTIANRQMQMMVGEVDPVITNYVYQPPSGPHTSGDIPQISKVEIGQKIDVSPWVMADGYTIGLMATASRTRFFGYASIKGFTGATTTNYLGSKIELPVTLPAIQMISASAQVNLRDNQTLVLFPRSEALLDCAPDEKTRAYVADYIHKVEKKEGGKTLIVLVTVTLIDAVGNRVHSDDEMRFAQKGPPAQSQTLPGESQNGNFPGVAPHAPLPLP